METYLNDHSTRNRAIWQMPSGVLVRCISEPEFEMLDSLRGFIVSPGQKIMVYVDGSKVAELSEGTYTFPGEDEIDELYKQYDQVWFRRIGRFLSYKVFGKTISKEDAKKENEKRRKRMEGVVSLVRNKPDAPHIMLYVIKAGAEQGVFEFSEQNSKPILTKSFHTDISLAVNFRITDFDAIVNNNLIDNGVLTSTMLVNDLKAYVRAMVSRVIRNYEVENDGIPEEAEGQIREIIERPREDGFSLELVEIASSNKDIARLASVDESLYLSGKELDRLQRTNEFENRLATIENQKKIDSIRNEMELWETLQEINKDKILKEDELDKFYTLLSRERRIRNAQSELEEQKALNEIAATGLLSGEQLEEVKFSLAQKQFDREKIGELIRLRGLREVAREKLDLTHEVDDLQRNWEHENEIKSSDHESRLLDKKLERQGKIDDYKDKREHGAFQDNVAKARELQDLENRGAKIGIDIEQQKGLNQIELLRQKQQMALAAQERLKAMEREDKLLEIQREAQVHAHEQELTLMQQQTERARIEAESKMSAQQLLAKGITGNQMNADSAAAASELAKSFSSENEAKYAKEYADKIQRDALREKEDLKEKALRDHEQQMEMMKLMAGIASTSISGANNLMKENSQSLERVAGVRLEDTRTQKEEYRQQMLHEQERMDTTQDKALDYTSKVTIAESQHERVVICLNCGARVPISRFCLHCKEELKY